MSGIQRQRDQFAYRLAAPKLIPNFDMDEDVFAGQAGQYGPGQPGIGYERHMVGDIPVDCLLHRDAKGKIIGILNYFPKGTPYEKPHSMTVMVHPKHRDKGIGSGLVNEALARFPKLNLEKQEYTPMGYQLYRNVKHQQGVEVPDISGGKP